MTSEGREVRRICPCSLQREHGPAEPLTMNSRPPCCGRMNICCFKALVIPQLTSTVGSKGSINQLAKTSCTNFIITLSTKVLDVKHS